MFKFIKYIIPGCLFLTSFTPKGTKVSTVESVFISHPTHISITNIDYLPQNNKLEIAVKVFTADIEYAIAHNYKVLLNLGKQNEIADVPTYISKYFNATFAIKINKKEKKPEFKGHETIDDCTWFYFEMPIQKKVKKMVLKNAILFDVFFDQTNLVIIADQGKETGTKLTFYEREYTYVTK